MLRIECPWCGVRDEDEFTYGGPAERKRPEDPSLLHDEEWSHYLFHRENPRGLTKERWRHTLGCRLWFVCERDTLTHVIQNVYSLDRLETGFSPIEDSIQTCSKLERAQ
jgi:sarcosine oxidase subunit delta